ncbi:MAG: extracellular solute-binding protein [Sphaerochaetaceae bacterium]|nr:extracellular solute-binding protein [Sphaerochaetaceae bacterium]
MKKSLMVLVVCFVALTLFAQGAKEASSTEEQLELVVYAASSQEEAEVFCKAFNEVYPNVKVTILKISSGDLVTRVKTEWPKPEGDVILSLAYENLKQIGDYLEGYETVNDAQMKEDFIDPENDPPKYYGLTVALQQMMYNTDLLKGDDIPKSWKDLADPKYKGKIVLANPSSSGSAYAQFYMMSKMYGLDFIDKVLDNATIIASSETGPELVARGEYAITVTGEKNIVNHINDGYPVVYVALEEGTGNRGGGNAILKNCKNLEAAKLFMDFSTSQAAFEIVRGPWNVRAASDLVDGPDGLPSMSELKLFEYDTDEAAAIKKELISQINALM